MRKVSFSISKLPVGYGYLMWPSHSSSSLSILGFRMLALSSFAFKKLHPDSLRLNPAENFRTLSRGNSLRKWDRGIVLTNDYGILQSVHGWKIDRVEQPICGKRTQM
jgi:hypothetical protein